MAGQTVGKMDRLELFTGLGKNQIFLTFSCAHIIFFFLTNKAMVICFFFILTSMTGQILILGKYSFM